MDPEMKRQLEEIHALAKDTNRMLHAMRRDYWLGLVGKLIFWRHTPPAAVSLSAVFAAIRDEILGDDRFGPDRILRAADFRRPAKADKLVQDRE